MKCKTELKQVVFLGMEKLYSTADAARVLGLKPSTLVAWRCLGRGPAFKKMGNNGNVRYSEEDIATFLSGCVVMPRQKSSASDEP
jgi:hypothetical protein